MLFFIFNFLFLLTQQHNNFFCFLLQGMWSKSFAIPLGFSPESPQFVYNSYLVYHSSSTFWTDKFIMELITKIPRQVY